MKTIGERLRWARLAAGYKTQSDFCRAHGVTRGTYGGYETDHRAPDPETAKRISEMLQINAGWLLTGTGPAKGGALAPTNQSVRWAPVLSWIQAGQLGSADMNAEADQFIPVLTNAEEPVALEVRGTSMNRIAKPRSHIIVDPSQRSAEDGWAVVALVGGEVTFKRYRCTNGPIRLEPDSTEAHETIYPDENLEILGRVIKVVSDP